jgi:exopolysaccharide production protein ExoY
MRPPGYSRAEQTSEKSRARASLPQPHIVETTHAHSVETAQTMADGNHPTAESLDAPLRRGLRSEDIKPPIARPVRLRGAQTVKRALDIVGALVLALLFSPLMILASIVLARTGSVLYRHRRVGAGGKMFECLKFRTMVPDADRLLHELLAQDDNLMAEWLHHHKLRHDPRVTPIGRFLRRTSLDELPQLWNVLRGEMSLVGPRPVIREELLRYGRASATYLAVRPGITGLWQTMGRNDTNYRRRVTRDVYYVRNQTVLLDMYILAKTVRVVLAGDGAY